ncbi:hypothetical protein [Lysinibacillus sphaericus]|uniref:hypothetical protein n=1 Tax=Lysinibacillus sphaericus TaxID=1421 RepID=UPI001CBFE24F|nr:hypothetical protein [Lysinibacillus sphaericus]
MVQRIQRPGDRWIAYQHDGLGKIIRADYYDDTWETFGFDKNGSLIETENEHVKVKLERGPSGQVIKEWQNKDTIIFTYSIENELYLAESYIFRELTEDVFIVFDEQMTLKYLILEKTSTFNYQNINNDLYNLEAETKYDFIKLYFKIYTYNQNDVVEIQNLIDEIISFKKNTENLDLGISVFLNEEITYLKDELVDSEEL